MDIPLTQGQIAHIDAEDAELVCQYSWCAAKSRGSSTYYAMAWVGDRYESMHRLILQPRSGMVIDHRNGNGLDNRRCNLRECSQFINSLNRRPKKNGTSKYKGVTWDKQTKKWKAALSSAGKTHNLGRYTDEEEAARAYDRKARELWGDDVWVNFPEEGEQLSISV